jgi:pyruvate, orthophosphate dikinase
VFVRMAVAKGRAGNPSIELGVCGEHGGDPASIEFFAEAGLDYVSCSPFRAREHAGEASGYPSSSGMTRTANGRRARRPARGLEPQFIV